MYMDDIKQLAKNGKVLETLREAVRICSGKINMEFGIEKCIKLIMKSGKQQMTKGIELPRKKRMLGEKETYKYLEILEMDTITQAEIKGKMKKRISGEHENYLRLNYIAEISSTR